MSVEYKKNGSGKCPVMHGSMTEQSKPTHWWPKNLNLDIKVIKDGIKILRLILILIKDEKPLLFFSQNLP